MFATLFGPVDCMDIEDINLTDNPIVKFNHGYQGDGFHLRVYYSSPP